MGVRRPAILGERNNRLEVIEILGFDSANKRLVRCQCDCGKMVDVRLNNLRTNSSSCGCYKGDEIRSRMGKPIQDLAANAVYHNCLKRSELKHWKIDLDVDFIKGLIFESCFYCKRTAEEAGLEWRRTGDLKRSVRKLGLDRVDNAVGYMKTNVVPCCYDCNMIKLDHNPQLLLQILPEMIAQLQRMENK